MIATTWQDVIVLGILIVAIAYVLGKLFDAL